MFNFFFILHFANIQILTINRFILEIKLIRTLFIDEIAIFIFYYTGLKSYINILSY